AFPPSRSISLTTDAAASAPFEYVMATFAPSEARRLAIAAPMPRDPPVISAVFPSSFLFMILFSSLRFVDSLCIDWYKTRRRTKPCQVIYLPIGIQPSLPPPPRPDDRVPSIIGPKAYKCAPARGEASLSKLKCGEVADA